MAAARAGQCATYAGKVGFFAIDLLAGHIIKTEDDLKIAEALWEKEPGSLPANVEEGMRDRG